jgi:hypothetical protein
MEQLLITENGKNIIVRNWKYENENELQEVIKKNPGILNLSSIFKEPIMIIGRESQQIDVLGITMDYVPVVIECKRKANPDMRHLIAQVFEYASKLDEFSYNDFDQMVIKYLSSDRCEEKQYKNLNLASAFKIFWDTNAVNDREEETFDEVSFVNKVSENLKEGEFYLVIVVDEISEPASRTIEFLNRKLHKLRVEVIEISKFIDNKRTIYVPSHVNKSDTKSKAPQPGKITFEEMVESVGVQEAEYIKTIRSIWEEGDDFSIHMGTKGFSVRYKDIPILYILPSHFRIAPRLKREYKQLFEDVFTLLEKHFNRNLQVGVNYNSPGFSCEDIKAFLGALKELVLSANGVGPR